MHGNTEQKAKWEHFIHTITAWRTLCALFIYHFCLNVHSPQVHPLEPNDQLELYEKKI